MSSTIYAVGVWDDYPENNYVIGYFSTHDKADRFLSELVREKELLDEFPYKDTEMSLAEQALDESPDLFPLLQAYVEHNCDDIEIWEDSHAKIRSFELDNVRGFSLDALWKED